MSLTPILLILTVVLMLIFAAVFKDPSNKRKAKEVFKGIKKDLEDIHSKL